MSINSRNGNTLLETGVFPPVRAATTAAIALAGLQTIDGIALAEGDRVLVKDNADKTTNGIFAASSGDWVRTSDAASNSQFFSGMAVNVGPGGTVNAGLTLICTCTDDPVVIGTSLLTFAAQSTVQAAQQSATSTTSAALTTGAKTFTTQSGKSFSAKQWVLIYETANPDNNLLAEITSYSGSSLVVNVLATAGSGGPYTDWSIVLTNSAAAAGRMPPVGSGNTTGAASSTTGHLATFADTTGKVLADGGKAGAIANLDTLTAQYLASSAIAFGVGMLNGTIVESHAAGALTVAIKTLAGNDPSASDPVYFVFRDVTAATGDYVVRTVTAALSLTISSGSTLGFSNGTAGRLWLVAFDDAGTVRIGVINCLSNTASARSIYPLAGWNIASSVADDGAGGSDNAQQFYTANAHAVASRPYLVVGHLTWETALATAGTWNVSPDRIKIYGPGCALPGQTIQPRYFETSSQTTITSTTNTATALADSITPSSKANLVRIAAVGNISYPTAAAIAALLQLYRNNGVTAIGNVCPLLVNVGAFVGLPTFNAALDFPQSTSAVQYGLWAKAASGTPSFTFNGAATPSLLTLDEIMA